MARTICEAADRCCSDADDRDCITREGEACDETLGQLLDDPRLAYVPDRAGDYLAGLELDAADCFAAPRADLRIAFEGTVPTGAGCTPVSSETRELFIAARACGDEACRFYLDASGDVDALCEPRDVAGDDVCSHPYDCPEGSYCELAGGWAPGGWGACRPLLGDGWNCTRSEQCESGFCDAVRCAPRPELAQCLLVGYPQVVGADGPIVYLRLSERSGSRVIDSSGNGHEGTYTDPVEHVDGAVMDEGDEALSLAGDGGHARIAGITRSAAGELSVELLVSIPDAGGGPLLTLTGEGGELVRLVADGRALRASIHGAEDAEVEPLELASSGDALSAGFHHVGLVVHEGQATLVLDGASVAQGMSEATLPSELELMLGMDPSAAEDAPTLHGVLDEVALYGHALEVTTLAAHAAAARSGQTHHDSFVYGWAR